MNVVQRFDSFDLGRLRANSALMRSVLFFAAVSVRVKNLSTTTNDSAMKLTTLV